MESTCLTLDGVGAQRRRDHVDRWPSSRKTPHNFRPKENDIHKALRAWYLTPGIQRDLRNKENEAVQTVLELVALALQVSFIQYDLIVLQKT